MLFPGAVLCIVFLAFLSIDLWVFWELFFSLSIPIMTSRVLSALNSGHPFRFYVSAFSFVVQAINGKDEQKQTWAELPGPIHKDFSCADRELLIATPQVCGVELLWLVFFFLVSYEHWASLR